MTHALPNTAELLKRLHAVAEKMSFAPQRRQTRPGERRVGRFAYIPVEMAVRELPSRAWLAGQLAQRGFQVVIGATWGIFTERFFDLPPGVVLFKTMNNYDANNMVTVQKAGHIAAVLNEEAFGLLPELWLYRAECDANVLELADLLCAQGARAAGILRELAGDKVAVTGNPRAVAQEMPRGDDILVCTMAGNINGFLPFEEYMTRTFEALGSASGDVLRLMEEQIRHEAGALPLMVDTIAALARAFPERRIRVRPHPSENRGGYSENGNVVLDAKVPFLGSLRTAATVVFVSGCGTGLESFLHGMPAVRLGTGGHGISAELHLAAMTAADAVSAVKSQLEAPQMVGTLEGHFAPVTLPAELDNLQAAHSANNAFDLERIWKARPRKEVPQDFHKNKFPETSDAEVEKIAGCKVQRLGWNIWLVRA